MSWSTTAEGTELRARREKKGRKPGGQRTTPEEGAESLAFLFYEKEVKT